MRGFPMLKSSRERGPFALLAVLVFLFQPTPAAGQDKANPPQQPPASGSPINTSRTPLTQEAAYVRLGDKAPNFKVFRDGQETSFHAWRGERGAVLVFADQTQEIPNGFARMVDHLEKIDVCTVAICRSSGAIQASVPTDGPGAILLRDRWGDLARQFGVVDLLSGDAVPAVVILDPAGVVRYFSAGAIPDLLLVEGIVNGVLERAKQETY